MKKPYPALCADCKYSVPEPGTVYSLDCVNPIVNGKDPWALSAAQRKRGTSCRTEREKRGFWAQCGIKGKLWEPREDITNG